MFDRLILLLWFVYFKFSYCCFCLMVVLGKFGFWLFLFRAGDLCFGCYGLVTCALFTWLVSVYSVLLVFFYVLGWLSGLLFVM